MITSPPAVLIVEDDAELRGLISSLIAGDGYETYEACEATAAEKCVSDGAIDMMILDIMLPGKDGLTFCRDLRASGVNLPIIMLTAKGDDIDRILGLEMGADDYLAKPFHGRELLARIRAVLRRANSEPARSIERLGRFVDFAGWRLDKGKRELLTEDGVAVPLSSAEFELLSAFILRPQMVLSRELLIDLTHGRSAVISDRSIDIQVSRLRRKLNDDPKSPRLIKTVWGDGYLFTPDIR